MMEEDILINMLYKFLSLFKITVDEYIKENVPFLLKIGKKVELYDNYYNQVGYAYFKDNKLIIQIMKEKNYISAIGAKKDDETYEYKYLITSTDFKNNLRGTYFTKEGKKLDKLLVTNSIEIFKDKELLYKCRFETLRNTIKLIDKKNNESAFYRNNEFSHQKKDEDVKIFNKNGEFEYYVSNANFEDTIFGYSYVDNYKNDYTLYETEFRRIIKEIDPDYFNILNKGKNLVNDFSDGLFERICVASLKNYNKEQLKDMLDIDFKTFEKPYVKKIK